jgi:hypothetical protein
MVVVVCGDDDNDTGDDGDDRVDIEVSWLN